MDKERADQREVPDLRNYYDGDDNDHDQFDRCSSSEECHEKSEKTNGPSERKHRRTRNKYTNGESIEIVRYLLRYGAFREVGGNKTWKLMKKHNQFHRHSWQSLKEHYRRQILPKLEDKGMTAWGLLKYIRDAEQLNKDATKIFIESSGHESP